ncbi:MAG: histidine phosphatase family protein [Candidatus Nanopelagicales bacterium]|nr:histidine phosphatase family protein [Candidatus Nanopelagicales bacterium]
MESRGCIVLIRHGQTEWSLSGQHTGRTDMQLTPAGAADAAALRPVLRRCDFGLVLISPLRRARDTARMAGLSGQTDADLLEWDYGAWEGRTSANIRGDLKDPSWTIWNRPIPSGATPGEQCEDVATRARRVLGRCTPVLESGEDCVLVAHGHLLRILTATWLGMPAIGGRLFTLDAGSLSRLGFENQQEVILSLNARPDRPSRSSPPPPPLHGGAGGTPRPGAPHPHM